MRVSRLRVATALAGLLGAPANVSARIVRVRCVDGFLSRIGGQEVEGSSVRTGHAAVPAIVRDRPES